MARKKSDDVERKFDIEQLLLGKEVLLDIPEWELEEVQKKENTIDSDGNTFERLKKPDLFAFVDDIRNRKTCNLFDKEENTKAFSTLMVLRFLSQKIYPIVRKAQWDKNINKFGEPTYSKGPDAEDIFICNEVNMRWQTMEPKDVYWFLLHTIEKDANFYPSVNNFGKKSNDEIILRIAKYFQCSFKRAREYHNLCGQPFEDYINKKFGDTKLSEEG
jgi:hypothetical protein